VSIPDDRESSAVRKGLQEFLSSASVNRPRKIEVGAEAPAGWGSLRGSEGATTLYLVPEETGSAMEPVRLVFAKEGETLPLPAGSYTIRHYSVQRTWKGQTWTLSSSGKVGRPVDILSGATSNLDLDTRVHLGLRLKAANDGNVRASVSLTGDDEKGVAVFRGSERIPVVAHLLGDTGTRLAEAPLAYG
jgi:hypothetical protein